MIYKKNFLKKVIFRIDFDKIKLGRLETFLEKIKKDFPIVEKERGEEGVVNINLKTKEFDQASSPITSWNIYNKSKSVKIKVHPKFLTIEYFKYKSSIELLANIEIVLDFLKTFDIATINRMGLRYINEIKVKNENPLDWKKYINDRLLGSINFTLENNKTIARAISYIIFKEEFGDINFHYGLWNSSYPNPISERVFILDFDAHSKFPLEVEGIDLANQVTEYNQKIEALFEKSIKAGLRTILNK